VKPARQNGSGSTRDTTNEHGAKRELRSIEVINASFLYAEYTEKREYSMD
jgi:hypothetical protein